MALQKILRSGCQACGALRQGGDLLSILGANRQQLRSASSSDDENATQQSLDSELRRTNYRSWVEDMLTSLKDQQASEGAQVPGQEGSGSAAPPASQSREGNQGLQPEAGAEQPNMGQEGPSAAEPVASVDGAPASVASTADASSGGPSSRQVPTRVVVQEQMDAQPDSVVGYRELGISESRGAAEYLDEGQGRINRLKVFYPCHTYSAEDLVSTDPSSFSPYGGRQQKRPGIKKATNAEALQAADFRNVPFLHKFTSEAGYLPPRRVTRLQKKVHVHVMKQIKIARHMALLPHEGKLEELIPKT